ncbi:ATP-binding cassette domain-containing protein [Streptantibioticus cattleyicolor]|uniref:Putative ABC transporter ATP-binding subunit n=1 Tax=Streptantibioticus cattleyicolor (strain ATCC 35852 / DSM 46488 / JCM 4925 / NBRC 14057 / NRRL 8057) TaxID=1003195 RepID=F8JJD4_STREN|nr:ABC transporter ATP-binding protein [Streptantibioticus cattleyicolor]AEW98746.1 putative ABC transporter ATP-binding subunit [Streptantibioticus cattleyicolor NRRL 8057 = DSM 46488]CCB72202.1 ABC transporter [Streptantibioticus cattleyicolor NRRL 8057 = DSM 46488]
MREPTARRTAVEAVGVGSRRRRKRVLDGCSFRIPTGRVCGVVGPNGAGKSTLLALAAGLLRPDEGTLRVFGAAPRDAVARAALAFVGQDKPLYHRFTVAALLRMGRDLNPGWRDDLAERMLDLPASALRTRVGALSGGERTRVALALALGKAPALLLLDEPLADLDPLARRHVMGVLLADAVERGTTVVMSSHVLAELDDVIDYLLLVDGGRIRLAGETDEILAAHRLLVGPAADGPPTGRVVESRVNGRQRTLLLRAPAADPGPAWQVDEPGLAELLLSYLRSPQAPPLLTPTADTTLGAGHPGVTA